jgi:hypothetical protein
MPCVLRASGKDFDVDAFLQKSKLKPTAVWRKGEPRRKSKPDKKNLTSGFNCDVSEQDFNNLKGQIIEAQKFLKRHKPDLQKLVRFSGVEGALLDFGFERRDVIFSQSDLLPAELIRLAGSIGLAIEMSLYPPTK